MKNLICIVIILFSIQTNGQNSSEKEKFKLYLLTNEKTSNDTIRSSVIEVFSGKKRIQTSISDFDGISVFYIQSKDIIDHKIRLKIYGPKCKIFEKEFLLIDDLNTKINLEYGDTDYTHPKQVHEMLKKLNIKVKFSEMKCGTVD